MDKEVVLHDAQAATILLCSCQGEPQFSFDKGWGIFIPERRTAIRRFERIKNETIQIGCGNQNVLRLGYLKTYSGSELLNAVLEYNDIYPNTQVHIQNGNHEALYHLLNGNQLDVVLNDQRRAFSDKYVNANILCDGGATASYFYGPLKQAQS